jgi:mannose-6-phosphate isomerase-like protein (cupin superfamily)
VAEPSPIQVRALQAMPAFITADGSAIRELAGPTPQSADSRHQSLAEATVEPGGRTAEHYHPRAEEIYYFVEGAGRLRLGGAAGAESAVRAGDCVVIAPGTLHTLFNDGPVPLVLLCCCAPPYSDDDTVLTGG